jgi:transporter family-2 protein
VIQQAQQLRTTVPLATAFGAGSLVALQTRLNGDLGTWLNDPLLAAVVSFGTGLATVVLVLAAKPGSRARLPALKDIRWSWRLGGLSGAVLVAVGATVAPKVGVALLTVGLVAGTTVGALLIDRIGFGPGGVRPITGFRLAGAALCLIAIGVSVAEGVRSASPWLLVLVVIAGGLISFQQAVNGRVLHATDVTVTTFLNFVIGTAGLLVGIGLRELIGGATHVHTWPDGAHWFLYVGGPLGAAFIAATALVVRPLGVLRLGLALTAGQLVGAILLDLDRGVTATTVVAAALTLVAVGVSGRGRRA